MKQGVLILGLLQMHVLKVLTCTCKGMCRYYVQPQIKVVVFYSSILEAYKSAFTALNILCARTSLSKLERTNISLVSSSIWTQFHHPHLIYISLCDFNCFINPSPLCIPIVMFKFLFSWPVNILMLPTLFRNLNKKYFILFSAWISP